MNDQPEENEKSIAEGQSLLNAGLGVSELRTSLDLATKELLHGLLTDGGHHKQWALEQAFRALCTDDYVDHAKIKLQWEDGIAP